MARPYTCRDPGGMVGPPSVTSVRLGAYTLRALRRDVLARPRSDDLARHARDFSDVGVLHERRLRIRLVTDLSSALRHQ